MNKINEDMEYWCGIGNANSRAREHWDRAVAWLIANGKVEPKHAKVMKYKCSPLTYAAKKLYDSRYWRVKYGGSKESYPHRRKGRDMEKKRKTDRAWIERNPAKAKECNAKAHRKRVARPEIKLQRLIRKRIARQFRNVKWTSKYLMLPEGMTFESYIKAKFTVDEQGEMMTFDNHGIVWELDHIYPCSRIDTDDPVECAALNHYLNLQPLTILQNRDKGVTVTRHAKVLFNYIKTLVRKELNETVKSQGNC